MRHTPGPWTVELDVVRNGDVHVFAAEMFGVADIDVREDQFDAGAPPMETALANARLIAAAPALLAKCKKVVQWLNALADKEEAKARECRFETLRDAYLHDAKNHRATAEDIWTVIVQAEGEE
jgi:hypothetical protein